MTPLACLVCFYFASLGMGGFVAARRCIKWMDDQ
jgi:hypothetical protein